MGQDLLNQCQTKVWKITDNIFHTENDNLMSSQSVGHEMLTVHVKYLGTEKWQGLRYIAFSIITKKKLDARSQPMPALYTLYLPPSWQLTYSIDVSFDDIQRGHSS